MTVVLIKISKVLLCKHGLHGATVAVLHSVPPFVSVHIHGSTIWISCSNNPHNNCHSLKAEQFFQSARGIRIPSIRDSDVSLLVMYS